MITFTTIDALGEPVSFYEVTDEYSKEINTPAGQTAIDGKAPANSYYLNGWITKPVQPLNTVWNATTKVWADIRTVEEVKVKKWAELKAAREVAFDAPLTTPFGIFDCTLSARRSITDAVMMLQTLAAAGTPTDITFTLANNTEISLTTAQMVQVGLLLGAKTQAAYARGRAVRELVAAALTIADVEAIIF